MRVTLNLDDDSLGKAASELIRRGWDAPLRMDMVDGFFRVVLPKGGKKIATERVKQLLEDEI